MKFAGHRGFLTGHIYCFGPIPATQVQRALFSQTKRLQRL